ncbi:Holliday junction branch migration protein RuvA [Canibacter zhoujuaniae]|uniref:Holliday junction branch migration protein RuvA n=1 Tax=Canibacter zhoujuaniae TaxID=2708343 RepID=UPI00141F2DB4|nr:Holliday junction branch migration protein RuvA [Canibacter zhoujuaniae]
MIASIRGEVTHRAADHAVVDTGALGYRVELPAPLAATTHTGDKVFWHTQLIVREDAQTLFGFADREQLEVFNLLLSVNGVGPRSALGVLSALTPQQIATAVAHEDPKPFQAVSGIGPKSAKMIMVSLAGKVASFASAAADPQTSGVAENGLTPAMRDQVVAALTGMGFNETAALTAVDDALQTGVAKDTAAVLKAALVLLQNR